MNGSSRVSMISSAAALIGAHGLSGTSFSDVLADSGAPRGSIYHHFPGGKRQLAGSPTLERPGEGCYDCAPRLHRSGQGASRS